MTPILGPATQESRAFRGRANSDAKLGEMAALFWEAMKCREVWEPCYPAPPLPPLTLRPSWFPFLWNERAGFGLWFFLSLEPCCPGESLDIRAPLPRNMHMDICTPGPHRHPWNRWSVPPSHPSPGVFECSAASVKYVGRKMQYFSSGERIKKFCHPSQLCGCLSYL